jgi:O-antigen/teichoic acid export membrane protein
MLTEAAQALALAFVALCAGAVALALAGLAQHVWRAWRWRRRLRELLRGQPTQRDLDEHMRRMRER